jgi:hypothetical protein
MTFNILRQLADIDFLLHTKIYYTFKLQGSTRTKWHLIGWQDNAAKSVSHLAQISNCNRPTFI